MEDFDPTVVEKLILSGAVEAAGIDEDGKMTYRFTKEAQNIAPDLYNSYMEQFYADLMSLWEKGFISMDITEQNPKVTIIASKFIDDEATANLTQQERNSLHFIVAAMKDK